jgi:ribosome-associated protein
VFDVDASEVLSAGQKTRIRANAGPRITAIAQDARSQTRNREIALDRLRRKLELALHVPRKRTPTRPTKGSKQRRLDAKKRQSDRKQGRRRSSWDD